MSERENEAGAGHSDDGDLPLIPDHQRRLAAAYAASQAVVRDRGDSVVVGVEASARGHVLRRVVRVPRDDSQALADRMTAFARITRSWRVRLSMYTTPVAFPLPSVSTSRHMAMS